MDRRGIETDPKALIIALVITLALLLVLLSLIPATREAMLSLVGRIKQAFSFTLFAALPLHRKGVDATKTIAWLVLGLVVLILILLMLPSVRELAIGLIMSVVNPSFLNP